jgi:hypothetical protein
MSSYGQMSTSAPISRSRTPVLTGVETSEASVEISSSLEGKKLPEIPIDVGERKPADQIGTEEDQGVGLSASSKIVEASATMTPSHSRYQTKPLPENPGSADETQPSAPPIPPPQLRSSPLEGSEQTQSTNSPSAATASTSTDNAMDSLSDDLDPLGIGDVKDHVPQAKKAQERRREAMAALLQ